MGTLTSKQAIFVKEYLVDHNATRAAKSAGYSEKTAHVQGPRLLSNVRVRETIDAKTEQRSEKLELTADYVLSGIRSIIEICKEENPAAALKGFELLGKNLKLFTDKVELPGGSVQVILIGGKNV